MSCPLELEWCNLKRGQVYVLCMLKDTANVLKIMQLLNVFDRCKDFRNQIFNFTQYGAIYYNTV